MTKHSCRISRSRQFKIFSFISLLLLGLTQAYGTPQDGGLPGSYLDYAGGPVVLGMGRAYVGLAEGTDAVAWNPAGLGLLRPNMLNFSHTQTLEQANLDYIGYAQPIYQMGAVGLGYIRLDSGSIPQTDQYNRQIGSFSDVQQTVMMAYGIRPIRRLAIGTTLKFSQQSLAGVNATGYGMDLGILGILPYGISTGLRIENLAAPALKYGSGTDEFPRSATLGFAYRLFGSQMALTWDAQKMLDNTQSVQWKLGLQGTLWNMARLLCGFNLNTREFSFGLGYLWGRQEVNYATSTSDFGTSQRVGFSFAWGGFPVSIQAKPEVFSPIGIVKNTTLQIRVNHSKKIVTWILQIRNQSQDLVRSIRGSGYPPSELIWDGKTESDTMVTAGNYTYTLTLVDEDGKSEITPPQVVRVEYGTPLDTLELRPR